MSRFRWVAGGVVSLVFAVMPAGAGAAGIGAVVDLGQNVIPAGAPAVVGGQDEVPVQNGIWVNGSVEVPSAPASDPTAAFTPQAISGTGVAVGFATTSMGVDVPAYWDSAHAASFVEVPLAGLSVNGSPVTAGRLAAVDGTGEAVGSVQNAAGAAPADFAGLSVSGSGGLPAGAAQVVTSLSGSVHSLGGISAGWEEGADTSGALFAYNRQSLARASSGLLTVQGGPGGFADNGLLAGYANATSNPTPEVLDPSGAVTVLQVPPGDGAGLYGLNASGVVVGQIRSNSASTGATWAASTGVSTPLLSEVTANAPGFTALTPTAIDDTGDIDGIGVVNGQSDGFLVQVNSLVQLVAHAVTVGEPSSGSVTVPVTVTLSAASSSTVTVDYATADGTATAAHGDYTSTSGSLTFPAGATSETIPVQVNASGLNSPAGFSVTLSNPSGAVISVGTATVQITQQRNAGVSVSCLPQTAGSLADTCAVTVSDTSGRTPVKLPTGFVTVTANAGTVAGGGSCGSAVAGAGSFTCTVGYTPPAGVGGMASPPVVTADYAGDSNFVPATGTEAITCTSGAVLQLDSISSTAPSAHGFEIDEPATLHGCGLTAKSAARFGADDAEVTPTAANVASDRKSITVDVPEYAITGPLSVTDTSQAVSRTVTLGSPNPVTIDSWRNTNGFSFDNPSSAVTEADVIAAFSGSHLAVPGSTTVLRPWAYQWYLNHVNASGLCFGLGLISGEFATGALSPSTLQASAQTGFDLTLDPSLTRRFVQAWLAQWSDQFEPYRLQSAVTNTGRAVQTLLSQAMGGSQDGFDRPALVTMFFAAGNKKWIGHTEVAYGWEPQQGGVIIHTADSNLPFTAGEYADTTDATHEKALQNSWIQVSARGAIHLVAENLLGYTNPIVNSQRPALIMINPISALTGPLTLSRSTFTGSQVATLSLSPFDSVGSVAGPGGKAISLSARTSPVQVQPFTTSGPAVGSGSGISELRITDPQSTVTLSAGSRPIRALWQSRTTDVSLTTTAGRLRTGFAPGTGAFTLGPEAGRKAPRTATVQVTEKLAGDSSERILTVTGPADLTAGLTGPSAHVTAPTGGHLTLSLSALGTGPGIQTTTLGTITTPAGQTLTLTPGNWHTLATTTVRGRLSGGRHHRTRRLVLHNRKRARRRHS